jgi:hypothetical protein
MTNPVVQSFAQLCGPPIFGAIVGAGSVEQQLHNFPHAIIFGGCMLALCLALVVAARILKSRDLMAAV